MKIRRGFVSNSSSSSFVILLPIKFDINNVDFNQYWDIMDECEINKDGVIEVFNKLVSEKSLWEEDNQGGCDVLKEIFEKYIVATIECGPDDGQLILADRDKVKEIINEN